MEIGCPYIYTGGKFRVTFSTDNSEEGLQEPPFYYVRENPSGEHNRTITKELCWHFVFHIARTHVKILKTVF